MTDPRPYHILRSVALPTITIYECIHLTSISYGTLLGTQVYQVTNPRDSKQAQTNPSDICLRHSGLPLSAAASVCLAAVSHIPDLLLAPVWPPPDRGIDFEQERPA